MTFFLFLLLLLLVIYNSNFRTNGSQDAFPARFLPFSLLLEHSLYLDQWIQRGVAGPVGVTGPYFAAKSHGHLMSAYPIITPIVVTPLYVLPAWWLSRQSPPLYPYSLTFLLIVNTMEKLSASLIAAMSGALLFLAFRRIASRNVSLVVVLIYGLAGIRARPVLRVAFAATVAIALWVQVVGAFYYPAGNWDARPVSVDREPQRCWDWSDTQVLRSWRTGPAPPLLLNQWERLLQARLGVPKP